MENKILVDLLKSKLAQTKQEATEAERLAADYQAKASNKRALSEKIQAAIDGLIADSNLVSLEETPKLSVIKELPATYSTQEIIDLASAVDNKGGSQANQQLQQLVKTDSSRSPKAMQRPEYRGGYIQVTREVLKEYPEGLHIDQLVEIIFDTRNKEEFEKAKASFIVELGRGVSQKRLRKSEPDTYLPGEDRTTEPLFEYDEDEDEDFEEEE